MTSSRSSQKSRSHFAQHFQNTETSASGWGIDEVAGNQEQISWLVAACNETPMIGCQVDFAYHCRKRVFSVVLCWFILKLARQSAAFNWILPVINTSVAGAGWLCAKRRMLWRSLSSAAFLAVALMWTTSTYNTISEHVLYIFNRQQRIKIASAYDDRNYENNITMHRYRKDKVSIRLSEVSIKRPAKLAIASRALKSSNINRGGQSSKRWYSSKSNVVNFYPIKSRSTK